MLNKRLALASEEALHKWRVPRINKIAIKRHCDAILVFCVTAIIALTVVFLLFPVAVTALIAFDARDYIGAFPPTILSTRWFAKFWTDAYLWSGFNNSLLLAVAVTVVATAIGASAGLAVRRMSPRWRDLVTTAFLSPLVLPGVVIGFALLLFLSVFDWLPVFAKLLVGHLIVTIPYTIRMTLVGLAGVGATLVEAALSLGANERQAFFTITLPLAKNGIAAGAIFAFAFSMDDVTISLFLSDYNTYTLPVALIGLIRSHFELTIAAAAVALMGLTVVLLIVLDRVIGLERAIGGIHRG
ncbi:ABC transporter permease subunit [Bradyrhizobium sp. 182]|uniref:ABC transporter permease n=1 Tax=Bradyrhizobium sp. 182 TaxID=2782651 RepID=UPI001FFB0EB0|nr:ABC transporter permease subunit [Bradyrhizobium sp. 182]MCK1526193.1 ABC transporter permease subunit [Bradyrhizobium sp. 182]